MGPRYTFVILKHLLSCTKVWLRDASGWNTYLQLRMKPLLPQFEPFHFRPYYEEWSLGKVHLEGRLHGALSRWETHHGLKPAFEANDAVSWSRSETIAKKVSTSLASWKNIRIWRSHAFCLGERICQDTKLMDAFQQRYKSRSSMQEAAVKPPILRLSKRCSARASDLRSSFRVASQSLRPQRVTSN